MIKAAFALLCKKEGRTLFQRCEPQRTDLGHGELRPKRVRGSRRRSSSRRRSRPFRESSTRCTGHDLTTTNRSPLLDGNAAYLLEIPRRACSDDGDVFSTCDFLRNTRHAGYAAPCASGQAHPIDSLQLPPRRRPWKRATLRHFQELVGNVANDARLPNPRQGVCPNILHSWKMFQDLQGVSLLCAIQCQFSHDRSQSGCSAAEFVDCSQGAE